MLQQAHRKNKDSRVSRYQGRSTATEASRTPTYQLREKAPLSKSPGIILTNSGSRPHPIIPQLSPLDTSRPL